MPKNPTENHSQFEEEATPPVEQVIVPTVQTPAEIITHIHAGTDAPPVSYTALRNKPLGWKLISHNTFTSNTTISNLDGDTDKVYYLIIRTRHTIAGYVYLRFNDDSGTNYINNQHLFGRDSGTATHTHAQENDATSFKIISYARKQHWAEVMIAAQSGQERMIFGQEFGYSDYDNMYGVQTVGLWNNTTDNLTSISILVGTITSGEYWLYTIKK